MRPMCPACGERKATSTGVCGACGDKMEAGKIPDIRLYVPPPRSKCRACHTRIAQRREVCWTCERAICDGLAEDVRPPPKPCGRPRRSDAPRTYPGFNAVFFSDEAVQRRIAHTRARERARSSR